MSRFIVAAIADAKVMPSAAYLAARLTDLNPRSDTEIAIFSDSVADLKAARDFGISASLKLADFRRFPPIGRITGAAFFRLFLPDVVPDEVERILYLDTDVSIEDINRLTRLFELDMRGKAIAAVRDYSICFEAHQTFKEEKKRAGPSGKYLNSGVLLIDRRVYREQNLTRRFSEAAIATRAHDQAAINTVLQGDWLELSPAMNMMLPLWNSFARAAFPPALVHFIGDVKPWHAAYGEDHPIRGDMMRYLATSPWPKFVERPTFAQLWEAQRRGPSHAPRPRKFAFTRHADIEGVAELLRVTAFADVEQGITECRDWEVPTRGAALPQFAAIGGLRA